MTLKNCQQQQQQQRRRQPKKKSDKSFQIKTHSIYIFITCSIYILTVWLKPELIDTNPEISNVKPDQNTKTKNETKKNQLYDVQQYH